MQPSKLQRSQSFFITEDQQKNFFSQSETLYYHNGPDPVNGIGDENGKNPTERQLAKICHFVRQLFQLGLKTFDESSIKDWGSCFTAEMLQGKSLEYAASINYAFKLKGGDLVKNSRLICHDVSSFLPGNHKKNHLFQVVDVNHGPKYIVDLTIRQYINKGLKLREKEIVIFDELLKNGFIELTQERFAIYLNFFLSRGEFEKCDIFFENEWTLSEKTTPYHLNDLSQPTYWIPGDEREEKFKTKQKTELKVGELVKKRKF